MRDKTSPVREIVTDANLWLNVVLPMHPSHHSAWELIGDCLVSGVRILAPAWWQAEADSALRGMVKGALLTMGAAEEAQRLLDMAPVAIIYEPSIRKLARQIADDAKRSNVYDATYAALALVRECELWTADKRFYNAMQNEAHGMYPVRLVDNYARTIPH